jgi:hypothetical protein
MSVELKYVDKEFNGIKFKMLNLITEYIGWQYKLPSNNENVVIFDSSFEYPAFKIIKFDNIMDNIDDSISVTKLLIFDDTVDVNIILFCIQNLIKEEINEIKEQLDDDESKDQYQKLFEKLNDKFLLKNIDYKETIIFNWDTMTISN